MTIEDNTTNAQPQAQQEAPAPEASAPSITFDDVVQSGLLDEFSNYIQKQKLEEQKAVLKDAWGDDFQAKYDTVASYVKDLPPAEQQQYNNPMAAMGLATYLEKQGYTPPGVKQQSEAKVPNSDAPGFDKSTGQGEVSKPTEFSFKQIYAMSDKEYAENSAAIDLALKEGRIKPE